VGPVDDGYPVVAPVIPPIEETDDAVEVALPKCVAEPVYPPFPDFSGDCRILSYDGGARRIGDGEPAAVCPDVPWVNCLRAGVGDG